MREYVKSRRIGFASNRRSAVGLACSGLARVARSRVKRAGKIKMKKSEFPLDKIPSPCYHKHNLVR